jgi:hypothetical protein
MTALMLSVGCRRINTVETLILHGADVNAEDGPVGWTPMTWAAIVARGWEFEAPPWPTRECQPDSRFLSALLAAGGQPTLREAIILGDTRMAMRLSGRKPAFDINGSAGYRFDTTYLMMAAELGSVEMVDFLLDKGADLEGVDDLSDTALVRASEVGRIKVAILLLEKGANVNHDWPSEETPLAMAELHGHQELATLLVSHGAKR